MVLTDPDEAVGVGRAASELIRLFDQERAKAPCVGGQRHRQPCNAGTKNDDIVFLIAFHGASRFLCSTFSQLASLVSERDTIG